MQTVKLFSPSPLVLSDSIVIEGDVHLALGRLPSESVQCVVTSPPYWGLRDYGIAGQIGLEPTLAGFIQSLTIVFAEVKRVLKADGVLWLNIGDGYTSGNRGWRAPENPNRAMNVRPDNPPRLGEAEKSHQSAKQQGFVEFWTIFNVPELDLDKAHEKSPTTNRFYNLRDLLLTQSDSLDDFRDRLISSVGILAPPA